MIESHIGASCVLYQNVPLGAEESNAVGRIQ